MKTLIKYLSLISLATLLIFGACNKKSDEDDPPAKTTTEMLTAGYWKSVSYTSDPGLPLGGTIITDLYAQWEDCRKDNIMKFKTNGFLIIDEGATKCDLDDPQTVSDESWVLSADGKTITIDGSINVNILILNESTLEVDWFENYDGISYNINRRWNLQ